MEKDTYHLAIDGAYERKKFVSTGKKEGVRLYMLVSDYRVAPEQWLRMSAGRKISDSTGSQATVSVLYNWGLEKTPIEPAF